MFQFANHAWMNQFRMIFAVFHLLLL